MNIIFQLINATCMHGQVYIYVCFVISTAICIPLIMTLRHGNQLVDPLLNLDGSEQIDTILACGMYHLRWER